MGRPSDFSEEIARKICEQIADGSNLSKLCALDEYPTRTTVYSWFRAHPTFLNDYACARETRGEGRGEEVDAIKQQLANGDIDYNVARTLLDAVKWQAGKECPKLYGDRTTSVQVNVPVDATALKALTELPQEDLEAAIALGEKLAAALMK